jgi:hypothetical protein
VNSFAAVVAFVGLKGGDPGACGACNIERLIVIEDMVADDGNVGGIDDEDAFKIRVVSVMIADGR